jgi:hypothetical protein
MCSLREGRSAAVSFCVRPYHSARSLRKSCLRDRLSATDCAAIQAPVPVRVGACRTVLPSLVGRMSAVLPIRKYCARTRTTGKRHMQAEDGAPGLDRTADTRFRKLVLYPLSYEGIVPICRYFVFLRPGKNSTSC